MITIAAFLGIFAIGTMVTPQTTSRAIMFLIYALPQIGLWGLWISLGASLISATQYTRTFAEKLKKIK